jgi:hypothetical protein
MRRSIWFWLLIAVLVVLLLGVMFGGYRKGIPTGADQHSAHQDTVAVSVA